MDSTRRFRGGKMDSNSELQVILGTGPLGQAVLHELIRQGKRVRLVNRSGNLPGKSTPVVEVLAADLYDPAEVRRVINGAAVVYHTIQPPYDQWPEKFPRLQASVIEGLSGSGARLVMGDNLYMYGMVNGPIQESLPYRATNHKGSTRARIAEMLLEAHHQGKFQATIGRGSDFFGPGVTSSAVGKTIFGNLAKGKAANVLGNPDLPHTYTFIDDFGKALVVLGEHAEAFGQAWHVPNSPAITTRQFVEMAADALGVKARMMVAGPLMMRALGLFVPEVREMIEMEYEFTKPFIVDDSRYKKAFGDHSTPLKEAIRFTTEWYQSRN
jgi:nucleoside-diphosphate-sugar epimerase